METKILPCTCKSAYQDAAYGPGKRVHNYGAKAAGGSEGWRCTVCSATKRA